MATWSEARVVAQRLRTQRLTSAPLATSADVVELLTCVQAQERDHAFHSLALRSGAQTYAEVRESLDRGEFVRTHILRPTWHFVLPADLRWILALTSARVEQSLAAQHRRLGLDDARVVDRGLSALRELLDGRPATRDELGVELAARRIAEPGAQLGQLLMIAELRGVICGGPVAGAHHTYVLVDEVVPATAELDHDDALRRLVHRFFAGHGPASVADFVRWSSLLARDTRRALAELGDLLVHVTVGGVEQWFDPTTVARTAPSRPSTWLLPVYDEVVLTYPRLRFPAPADHPYAERPDPFWAPVVHRGTNVGLWKRTVRRDRLDVETRLAPSLDAASRDAVAAAATRMADFLDLPLAYSTGSGTPPLWRGGRASEHGATVTSRP